MIKTDDATASNFVLLYDIDFGLKIKERQKKSTELTESKLLFTKIVIFKNTISEVHYIRSSAARNC